MATTVQVSPRGHIEFLPLEIQQMILSSIDDTTSLANLILTGGVLHRAFLGDRESIVRCVRRNTLESLQRGGVYKLAWMAHQARSLHRLRGGVQSSAMVQDWVLHHAERSALPAPACLEERDTTTIMKLVHCVDRLSTSYISEVNQELSRSAKVLNSGPAASSSEIDRIRRAILHVHILNVLSAMEMQGLVGTNFARQYHVFLSAWEHEQAVAVSDFIFKRLLGVYRDRCLDRDGWPSATHNSFRVRHLSATKDIELVDELISGGLNSTSFLTEIESFSALSATKHWRSARAYNSGPCGARLCPEDTDPGPELSWRWRSSHSAADLHRILYGQESTGHTTDLEDSHWERFWDFERLCRITQGRIVSRIPWESLDSNTISGWKGGPWGNGAYHLRVLDSAVC